MIQTLQNYFEHIKNTSSLNEKKELLEEYGRDENFLNLLGFLYNDYITTGLSKKKITKKVVDLKECRLTTDLFEMIEYIKKHNTGTDVDIAIVQQFIAQHEQNREFLTDIFTKNIKAGITSKTIDDVFLGLVPPPFGVMLAEKYNLKYVEGKEFIITLKLDGSRLICIKKSEEDIIFYSRQGKIIEGLEEIKREMKYYPNGVYDGELLAQGKFNNSKDQFKETMKRSRVKGVKTGLDYVLFDYIDNIEDFELGYCPISCVERKLELEWIRVHHILKKGVPKLHCIKHLPMLYRGRDIGKIGYWAKEMEQQGEEGIIINIADEPYQAKRVNHLLKVKSMQDVDLKVIGYQEGTGKNKGKLGALIVDYKGFEVKVGSGFSDKSRDIIWQQLQINESNIIGKIIKVQYFEETEDKNGNKSLRFPVFLGIREDKTEPSYY